MKNWFSIALIALTLANCTNDSHTFQLEGEVMGLKKGTLLLQRLEDTSYTTLDSMVIDGKSQYSFSSVLAEPEVLFLTMRFSDSLRTEKRIPFFAEPHPMQITATLKNYELENKVTGSLNQEKWEEYQTLMARYNYRYLDLVQKQFDAMKSGNDSVIGAVEAQQQRLLGSRYLATVNFAKNHNDMELAPYLMLSEVYDAQIKYHDTIYSLLTQKIKDSKYGKAMESFIEERKKDSL